MQTVIFTSHRARDKAQGALRQQYKNVNGAGSGVYGKYQVSDDDYRRIEKIKGVRRVAAESDILPIICEL
jgi:hypothetical protein